jgi:anti-sigma factor RsiW
MSERASWSDAQVHAYVDGELDAVTAAQLEADSRGDGALAARIRQQRSLRALLRERFDPVIEEPVPRRLQDVLAGAPTGNVTPIGRARPTGTLRRWSALAATLVFGALLGALALREFGNALPLRTSDGQLVASGYLDAALTGQLSGEAAPAGAARIGLSFRAARGEICRTFALQAGSSGLACRRGERWTVRMLEASEDAGDTSATGPDGFRQASSALSPAMLGALTALGAGEPLTREEEAQRRATGW